MSGWATGNRTRVHAQLGCLEERWNEPGSAKIAWNSVGHPVDPGKRAQNRHRRAACDHQSSMAGSKARWLRSRLGQELCVTSNLSRLLHTRHAPKGFGFNDLKRLIFSLALSQLHRDT